MNKFRSLKFALLAAVISVTASVSILPAFSLSGSDFRADRIIDDSFFFDSNSMSANDVQAFLNSQEPNCSGNCLKNYQQDTEYFAPDAYCGGVSAARKYASQIIKDVAIACGVSPKAILTLLEKEQSIVSASAPSSYAYTYATGFCVPDGPPPPSCQGTYGFSNQVYYAARQFQKYAKQPGNYTFRAGQVNSIPYNPNSACGASNVFIQNQATAGLYNYTPYQPNAAALNNLYGTGDSCSAYGNRNFWRIFSDWFGTTLDGRCSYDAPTPAIADVSFRKFRRNLDSGTLIIYTGTGTNCIEDHSWLPGSGFGAWQSHIASNLKVSSPVNGAVKFADLTGSGVDNPVYIGLNGTGSGTTEFHVWSIDMRQWIVHTGSNLPLTASGTNPSAQNSSIEFADLDGNGVDEPVAIQYKNTASGFVEFWVWNSGLQSWQVHAVSNLASPIDPTKMQIGFDNLYGNGRDIPVAFGISDTGTGKVEFHVWATGVQSWQQHIVSNLPTSQLSNCSISFADLSTSGFDNGAVVCKQGTGSGRIEFHIWNPDLTSWQGHYASNQTTF